jgi:hypothetical protein
MGLSKEIGQSEQFGWVAGTMGQWPRGGRTGWTGQFRVAGVAGLLSPTPTAIAALLDLVL